MGTGGVENPNSSLGAACARCLTLMARCLTLMARFLTLMACGGHLLGRLACCACCVCASLALGMCLQGSIRPSCTCQVLVQVAERGEWCAG